MLKHSQYAKWLALGAVFLLGTAGCGERNTTAPTDSAATNDVTARTSSAPVSDTSTNAPRSSQSLDVDKAESAVEKALEAEARFQAFDLDADENKGGIVLKGIVQTAQQRTLAEEIAKRTAPGIPIENQIRVGANASASPSPTGKPAVDADEAEDRVSDAFKANAELSSLDIEADEANGGILLKGTVQTAAQKTLAENTAKQVAPKFSIDNQIRIVQ